MWKETDFNSPYNRDERRVTAHSQVRMQMQITKRNLLSFKRGEFFAKTRLSRPRMKPGGEEAPARDPPEGSLYRPHNGPFPPSGGSHRSRNQFRNLPRKGHAVADRSKAGD